MQRLCLHICSFMLFLIWLSVFLLLRNAFSGFPLDWGQVATSSSLPSLQTGLPVRPHAYVRSYRFCPEFYSLCFTVLRSPTSNSAEIVA